MFSVHALALGVPRTYDWRVTTGTRMGAALGASVAAAMLFLLGSASGAPGDLDPTFGTNGVAEATAGVGNAMALQNDGMILVAGYSVPWELTVARYTSDGRLDRSFGNDGTATGPSGSALGMAVQTDAKIVATGYMANESMSVVRFTAGGALDAGFGSGGIARGPQGDGHAIAVQADGKILVAGTSVDPVSSLEAITVLRFRPDGAPDAGFGSNGVVRTPLGLGSNAQALALQPDGKIVVGGESAGLTLVRYEADGTLDQTFGSGGIVTSTAGGSSRAESLALEPEGQIVAVGGAGMRLAAMRFLPDGQPDFSFGDEGATTTGTGGIQGASDVAVQVDGRIVAAAYGPTVVTLVRFQRDGSLDPDFGEEGISSTKLGSNSAGAAVALEADGRILAGGFSSGVGETHVLVARFKASSPTTIGANPAVVPYRAGIQLAGIAADPQRGTPVRILARGCYAPLGKRPRTTWEFADGGWHTHVTPLSKTEYRAEILGDRSVSVTVQVRPRVMVRRVTRTHVRVRVLFGRALTGQTITLQRFRPATGWGDVQYAELQRVGRAPNGVLSGATFRAGRRKAPLRVLLRQPNRDACYATGVSRPVAH